MNFDGSNNFHMKTVVQDSDISEILDNTASLEGSGWGVHVSASVQYMKKHASSEHSVAYYVTSSGNVKAEEILNPYQWKAFGDDQLDYLRNGDVETFVETHGSYYISKIVYGSSFIGSIDITQKTARDTSELSVFAEIDVEGLWEGDAHVENSFNSAKASSSGSLDVSAKVDYCCDQLTSLAEGGTLHDMQGIFQEWLNNVKTEPEKNVKPLTMQYGRWTDLQQIQEVMAAHPEHNDQYNLYLQQDMPAITTVELLQEETVLSAAHLNSVENLLSWQCVASDNALKQDVESVRDEIQTHINILDSLSTFEVFHIQDQASNNDYSFFVARKGAYIRDLNNKLTGSSCVHYASSGTVTLPWDNASKALLSFETDAAVSSSALLTGVTITPNAGVGVIKTVTLAGRDIGFQSIEATVGVWAMYANENIPDADLVGCTVSGDIRNDAASIETCKQECDANSACVAMVAHPWGTMLKSSQSGTESRDGFHLYKFDRQGATGPTEVDVYGGIDWTGATPEGSAQCPEGMFVTGLWMQWERVCRCNHPGYCPNKNSFVCSDLGPPASGSYCRNNEVCYNLSTLGGAAYCQWVDENTCSTGRRRQSSTAALAEAFEEQLAAAFEEEQAAEAPRRRSITTDDGNYGRGRPTMFKLQCSSLPTGNYGLPRKTNYFPDNIISNVMAGNGQPTWTGKQCMEGGMVSALEFTMWNNLWMNLPIVNEIALKCRQITDFVN